MRMNGAFFSLSAALLPRGTSPKASCVVSKKVSVRAVDRNRIKRQCRHAVAPILKTIKKPIVFAFFARREALGAEYADLERDVQKLVERALSRYNPAT